MLLYLLEEHFSPQNKLVVPVLPSSPIHLLPDKGHFLTSEFASASWSQGFTPKNFISSAIKHCLVQVTLWGRSNAVFYTHPVFSVSCSIGDVSLGKEIPLSPSSLDLRTAGTAQLPPVFPRVNILVGYGLFQQLRKLLIFTLVMESHCPRKKKVFLFLLLFDCCQLLLIFKVNLAPYGNYC